MDPITTSFVIRVCDEEKWLKAVLQKLFDQTRKDFEVIMVDAGSKDKTLEIVNSFPITKVIKIPKEDFNYSYALNIGIKKAEGKYIGILSGHSLPVSNEWYSKSIKEFADPNLAAIGGHCMALPDGSISEQFFSFLYDKIGRYTTFGRKEYFKWLSNTNAFIRKDLWEQYPFDESLLHGCEDYDWAQEMLSRGYNVVKDPCADVYHSHGGIGKKTALQMQSTWNKITRELDQKQRPSEAYSKLWEIDGENK